MPTPPIAASLAWAHPVVQEWFTTRFGSPTEPQQQGWPHILAETPTLISAPTGSGKTLAAFLICIDRLLRKAIEGRLGFGTEVVYVSPLKALSNDVQKNLEAPLREIQQLALARGYLCPPIRAAVRTGDTSPAERRAMLKHPPHILVTTPESLYILLTSEKSREHLRRVHTVIVDEIHAMADDKRGAHLTLTLERLDALVTAENTLTPAAGLLTHPLPLRIGLSATQNPIELVAEFLGGARGHEVKVVQCGQRRDLDLAIEVPAVPLAAVATNALWESVYDRIAELVREHRSTLVFVNTRRMVERIAFQLGERLGADNVAAHHGSLSRKLRLEAERRLKAGDIRVLVATASLELGIDIGAVDLVCQINSTRAIAVAMQRVGRAGHSPPAGRPAGDPEHWRGAIPKGRFFVTTRDDLVESAALMRAMRSGVLDRLEIPSRPFDVLMQQIVAACAAEPWDERALYNILRRAHPYRDLPWQEFDQALCLLTEGIESSRGRYGAYLLRDRIHSRVQARRGARITAVTNGGTIPDTALFPVIAQPEGVQIATLDEHFAVDSSPGDIIQLGNASWRIQRVESAGRVLVEDAQGQPPTLPFWTGEAPQRTAELSEFVSSLRLEIDRRTRGAQPGYLSLAVPQIAEAAAWLQQECSVCESGAMQLIQYIVEGRAGLGAVPSVTTIVAERFFDEGGGMQLILHAPFGGRINKAWGLALRKRFCRGFNFELQAAATDNGINISLAEQHSFPLSDVFQFLTTHTVRDLLEQASLASPIFKNRWKWAAGRSLQLLRFQKGKKVAPQVQRTRGEDLLASVFPQAAACFENIEGDIQIPDHPLVAEVMKDVLREAMDLEGLTAVLQGIHSGRIQCLAVDTTTPSAFAHELLHANPYAFLDEAGLEERRARAIQLHGAPSAGAGRISPESIAEIRATLWPDIRDEHELHDLLCSLVLVPASLAEDDRTAHWAAWFARLEASGRATIAICSHHSYLCAAERIAWLERLSPQATFTQSVPAPSNAAVPEHPGEVLRKAIQGWMQILGPATARTLGERLGIDPHEVWKQFLVLETTGTMLRGVFEHAAPEDDLDIEWCERRILQRIHKATIGRLRKQVEPVPSATYLRFLLDWQHIAPQRQLTGEDGLLQAVRGLQGYEAPAIEWERHLLPQRVANYDPRWLDTLCLTGVVGWGRISPHPAFQSPDTGGPRRVIPSSMAPITFFLREEAHWMDRCLAARQIPEAHLAACLSELANRVRSCLAERGAMFSTDLARLLAAPPGEISHALWELVAAGLVTADGFDALRQLLHPHAKSSTKASPKTGGRRNAAGRWSLLAGDSSASDASYPAQRLDQQIESACLMLLDRYGIVFRDLALQETTLPRWRDLHAMFRRLEDRGLVRGGRFVSGFTGEQFALPQAMESLRACRQRPLATMPPVTVAAADPVNLVGTVLPGERTAAIPGRTVTFPAAALSPDPTPPESPLPASLLPPPESKQQGDLHA
jgi:ATP-dependent Lhr-like helicase